MERHQQLERPEPEGEQIDHVTPKIYVASLSDYNAGRLVGAWVDATTDAQTMSEEIDEMLSRSPEPIAEEYAIHDYEGFGRWNIHQYESLDRVSAVAEGITKHGLAFAALPALDDSADLDAFEDRFRGEWSSMEEFAVQMLEDQGIDEQQPVPKWLQPYVRIDIAALAQDMSADFDVEPAPGGGVYVFDPSP